MNEEKKAKRIDVEAIIGNKNPKLLKALPGFVLSYIKNLIHQDHINSFLAEHRNESAFEFVRSIINYFEIKVNSKGLENIPKTGGFVIASNHPLGGLDAMPLLNETSKARSDIKFLVNDILMNLENLRPLFVPINKHGKNAVENIQRISDTYSSEHCTMIFPAGLPSPNCSTVRPVHKLHLL